MYRENISGMFRKPTKVHPLDGVLGGSLLRHTKGSSSDEDYISRIPQYRGTTIPPILKRDSKIASYESDYYDLMSFLENFGKYDTSESWVVAGLLAETGIMGDIPIVGVGLAAIKLLNETTCKKQILCKRFTNKIVFLINVTGSSKEDGALNTRYSNKIMIINLPPIQSDRAAVEQPMAVPAGGFEAYDPVVEVFELSAKPSSGYKLNKMETTDINSITTTLSQTDTHVIDPNISDTQKDEHVIVSWFGNGRITLKHINDIIEPPLAPPAAQPAALPAEGGKFRSSKQRVTKTRKSTKRRHRRRRRRTSRK